MLDIKKILVLTLFIGTFPSFSQVESPPTLALGVAGVIGEKGDIDVQLLSEIIAEKQTELKKEFIKRTFFEKLDGKSYALWEFTYNTLDILLESKNKDAIKKNILKHSTNLAVTYGFTEFYLHLSNELGNSDLNSLVNEFNLPISMTRSDYFSCGTLTDDGCSNTRHILNGFFLTELKSFFEPITINSANDTIMLNTLIMDMAYEVLSKNKTLNELGLFNNQYPLGELHYRETSQYYKLLAGTTPAIATKVDSLFKRMEREVDLIMNNFLLVKEIRESDLSLNELVKGLENSTFQIYKSLFSTTGTTINTVPNGLVINQDTVLYKDAIDTIASTLFSDAESIYKDLQVIADDDISDKLSNRIADNLKSFGRFQAEGSSGFVPYDIYFVNNSMMPLLVELTTQRGLDGKYLKLANQFKAIIKHQTLDALSKRLTSQRYTAFKKIKIDDIFDLIDFIFRLDELDIAETYDISLKTIKKVSEMIEDPRISKVLTTLTKNLDHYTLLNEEKNQIDIAVEDIILAIYDKYGNRERKTVDFYFSLGLNQSLKLKTRDGKELVDPTGEQIKSLAFAAEKIGVKVKLINIKRRRSFDVGEYHGTKEKHKVTKYKSKVPIVSDIHWITYGSGLIYNIVNTTTEDNFEHPMVGTGLGVSFYNNMDLNLWMASPLVAGETFAGAWKNRRILGFSFDIRVSDYIRGLRKKRQEKKEKEAKENE